MATMTEQPKSTPQNDHAYPPPVVQYPHQPFNGSGYPPPGPPSAYPPFFTYPPPPDGNHPENGQNGAPSGPSYMMAFPPPPHGMVYAYPPPPQGQGFAPAPAPQLPPLRPKRKQVKMACTNCAAACKRCDENRPCERCQKYGISDTCVDGQRKERKKGIKRGPYRTKTKTAAESSAAYSGEWPPSTGVQSPPSAATTTAAIHAVAHQFGAPEGYYQIYYPPGPYLPPPPDGHDGSATAAHPGGQPPILPFYIHPGAYPPFPHYPAVYQPPPGQGQQLPGQEQQTTMDPSAAAGMKKNDDIGATGGDGGGGVEPAAVQGKKRRAGKSGDEKKGKKAKTARASTNGNGDLAGDKEKEKEKNGEKGRELGGPHETAQNQGEGDTSTA